MQRPPSLHNQHKSRTKLHPGRCVTPGIFQRYPKPGRINNVGKKEDIAAPTATGDGETLGPSNVTPYDRQSLQTNASNAQGELRNLDFTHLEEDLRQTVLGADRERAATRLKSTVTLKVSTQTSAHLHPMGKYSPKSKKR